MYFYFAILTIRCIKAWAHNLFLFDTKAGIENNCFWTSRLKVKVTSRGQDHRNIYMSHTCYQSSLSDFLMDKIKYIVSDDIVFTKKKDKQC